jgi:hypothetical protein
VSAGRAIARRIVAQRESAEAGDVAGTVRALFDHYEDIGDFVIRLLADEDRVPDMAEWLAYGPGEASSTAAGSRESSCSRAWSTGSGRAQTLCTTWPVVAGLMGPPSPPQ